MIRYDTTFCSVRLDSIFVRTLIQTHTFLFEYIFNLHFLSHHVFLRGGGRGRGGVASGGHAPES
jgi:hypothetical protein